MSVLARHMQSDERAQPTPQHAHAAGTPRALFPLFWLAQHAPRFTRFFAGFASSLAYRCSPSVQRATAANAANILGPGVTPATQKHYGREVLRSFYHFVVDVSASTNATRETLHAKIVESTGDAAYRAMREQKRGAIILTAHIGSFEVGLARLAHVEKVVRVVFKRDEAAGFEIHRRALREKLGIIESPIDDGIATWLELRDALLRDEVIVMQGDRAMPGQQSAPVHLLHGTLRMPTGPFKLARLTNSPIVPVFTVRLASDKYRVIVFPPIEPQDSSPSDQGRNLAMSTFATALESIIREYPEQWLVLHKAFEPASGASSG